MWHVHVTVFHSMMARISTLGVTLQGLEARAPQFYNASITMLKMLDVYFEVSGPACTLFLEQRGCAKVLELCARTQVDAESVVKAAPASTQADATFPPTDTGVVPARLRNLMKVLPNFKRPICFKPCRGLRLS